MSLSTIGRPAGIVVRPRVIADQAKEGPSERLQSCKYGLDEGGLVLTGLQVSDGMFRRFHGSLH